MNRNFRNKYGSALSKNIIHYALIWFCLDNNMVLNQAK